MCVLCKGCQEHYDINNNSEKKNNCRKCYIKKYKIDNRQKIKEQNKQWSINNQEKITIKNWKYIGLIELEGVYTYESLYEYYISITHCEVCKTKFKNSYYRCLDHCHTTGLFRWVLCRSCNTMDKWKNLI